MVTMGRIDMMDQVSRELAVDCAGVSSQGGRALPERMEHCGEGRERIGK